MRERKKMKFAIIYYSLSGHTKEMGEVIAEGIKKQGGEVRLFSIMEEMDAEYINACDGIIFGTPTYLASTCWQIKKWLEEDSRPLKLAGKLAGVYATAHYAQGGAEIAIMSIIGQLLVKGLLVYSGGGAWGQPYIHLGPVALDKVDGHFEKSKEMFAIFGERMAQKAKDLFA